MLDFNVDKWATLLNLQHCYMFNDDKFTTGINLQRGKNVTPVNLSQQG